MVRGRGLIAFGLIALGPRATSRDADLDFRMHGRVASLCLPIALELERPQTWRRAMVTPLALSHEAMMSRTVTRSEHSGFGA